MAFGEREIPLAGDTHLVDRIGNHEFGISANSFFQTNTRGAERLYEVVRKYAGLKGTETVFDLYSGTGTIPAYWQAKKKRWKSGVVSATSTRRLPRSRPKPTKRRAKDRACCRRSE